jgi:hypothetical protein
VFHCHILNHEDNGMMLVVNVADPNGANAPPAAGHTSGDGEPLITGEAH